MQKMKVHVIVRYYFLSDSVIELLKSMEAILIGSDAEIEFNLQAFTDQHPEDTGKPFWQWGVSVFAPMSAATREQLREEIVNAFSNVEKRIQGGRCVGNSTFSE